MRQVLTSSILAGLGLCVATGGAQAPAIPSPNDVRLAAETLVKQFMASEGPSAVSISVVRKGETLVSGGWGLAERSQRIDATAATSYRIGSITKQFTAVAVLRLVEQGRLALTDPVEKHLTDLPEPWTGVSIEQLLNHTAGIPDFTEIGGRWSRHWGEPMPPARLLSLVAKDKVTFPAGTEWQYSNTGYVVLGLLLERVTGRSYAEVIQSEFTTPLGLTHTRVCEDAPGTNGQALGYRRDGQSFDTAGYRHVSHWFGGGSLCSTVGDLTKWNQALHGGQVLQPDMYRRMTTPAGVAAKSGYGFGVLSRVISGHRELMHTGQFSGFATWSAWYPSQSLSVTVLTNTAPVPTKDILARNLALISLGVPVAIAEPSAVPAPDASTLRQYAGDYTLQLPGRAGLGIRVWVDGRTLKAQADRQPAVTLHAVGAHAFGATVDPSIRFTFTVSNGAATGLVFEQAGAKYEAVKKK